MSHLSGFGLEAPTMSPGLQSLQLPERTQFYLFLLICPYLEA